MKKNWNIADMNSGNLFLFRAIHSQNFGWGDKSEKVVRTDGLTHKRVKQTAYVHFTHTLHKTRIIIC
jgi:hypothetical protein